MGTRNLTMVIVDRQVKLAQYGQWDGYPSGQGVTALEALKTYGPDAIKKAASECIEISEDELKSLLTSFGMKEDGSMLWQDSKRFSNAHPHLHRDCGANILKLIIDGARKVRLNEAFAKDSLLCEYAYVIDFDSNTFEVYEGFNQRPLNQGDRFYEEGQTSIDGYYPIRLFKSFDLKALPSKEEFLSICEPIEE